MNRTLLSIGLVIGCASLAPGAEDVLGLLAASRKMLPPFHAIYTEVHDRRDQPIAEPGAELGWGSFSGAMEVDAAVDADGSRLIYKRMIPEDVAKDKAKLLASGGTHLYQNVGGVAWNLIEGGMRGDFGQHPTGMINPAAAAYEAYGGLPVDKLLTTFPHRVVDDEWVEVSTTAPTTIRLHIKKLGSQEVIVEEIDWAPNRVARGRVDGWVDVQGWVYPKTYRYSFERDGSVKYVRTWNLKEILDDHSPLKAPIFEGALVKDADTNVVYDVKDGKLVPNPIFNRETGIALTLRRLGFVAAMLLAMGCGWIWLCRRRRLRS